MLKEWARLYWTGAQEKSTLSLFLSPGLWAQELPPVSLSLSLSVSLCFALC